MFGVWNHDTVLLGGIDGSSVTCVFDDDSNEAAVLSAFENSMAMSSKSVKGKLQYGIMGNVTSIPVNFSTTMIVSFSASGVNGAIHKWGKAMRVLHGKHSLAVSRDMDITLQYLGYTTDNGAYYYYLTEPDKDYSVRRLANAS